MAPDLLLAVLALLLFLALVAAVALALRHATRSAQAIARVEESRDCLALKLEASGREMRDLAAAAAVAETEAQARADALEDLQDQFAKAEAEGRALRADLSARERALAQVREALEQERKQSAEKMQLLQEARDSMTREFQRLGHESMAKHGETFKSQNKEQIGAILQPLREHLHEFQRGLETARTESAKERAALGAHIHSLSETSARMTSETVNLTRALKGKAQTQGAWGEMLLESILEKSGLRAGEEYERQETHTTEDGRRLRPDVIVRLPGRKYLVIDAKVSLAAFETHVNAEEEEERDTQLTHHVTSMRNHICALHAKAYHASTKSDLDFVVMFVPIEGAFAAALRRDPGLTAFALQKNVAIATPATLVMALRTIRSVWQVERRTQNAEAIADRAGKLYDKFVGFLIDMETLDIKLSQARGAFDGAFGKLKNGPGNLVRQIEQLKGMGARTTKAVPLKFLDENDSDGLEAAASAPLLLVATGER